MITRVQKSDGGLIVNAPTVLLTLLFSTIVSAHPSMSRMSPEGALTDMVITNAVSGFGVAVASDGLAMAAGASEMDGNGSNSGQVGVYKRTRPASITLFAPKTGVRGTSVTNGGTGFSTTALENSWFNAATAAVTSTSITQPGFTLPSGASDRTIAVLGTVTAGISSTSFLPKVDFTTGSFPQSVAIGDIDGDGKPDLVVANRNSNTVSVLRNTSTSGSITSSSFASHVTFATGNSPRSVSIGDIDGDGKPDLVVANAGSTTVSVLRNTSKSGSITDSSFSSQVSFAAGNLPFCVSIGDLDGDNKPDLVVANYNSNTVSVLRNTSTSGSITDSSFASEVNFATGFRPASVSIGDLDGDGKLDLAVANWDANTVSVLRNTSTSGSITSSSFASHVEFATGGFPISVSIGDLDGDGKPDLAVVNNGSHSVSVLRNVSTSGSITSSSFASQVSFATEDYPNSVAIGDLDGDGKPDLAVANQVSNTVSVLRNVSTSGSITSSSFTAQITFPSNISPRSVAIGDLDGDGKPDLVVANQNFNAVSVLRNNIQADFPQLSVSGTLNPFSTTVGTPSATQSFTVSGTNLVANVRVNALFGYEYRVGDSGAFSSSLSLTPTSGTLAATTIQVRLTGEAANTYNGYIIVSSAGAVDQTIAVRGTVEASVSASSEEVRMPTQISLLQNYPNPFNPTTAIRFELPAVSKVTLEVFNTLGQRVRTLVSENRPAGSHAVTFDAAGLSSGVYMYRLQVGNTVMHKKMVLMK